MVVARTSGQNEVVFGSVLSGRLQEMQGADRAPGMFINTLPLKVSLTGRRALQLVQHTHSELVELLQHEQVSLAYAQRFSGVARGAPLFGAVMNYRHRAPATEGGVEDLMRSAGIRVLRTQERTNYPITVLVDDLGDLFGLEMQTDRRVDPKQLLRYLQTALESLTRALHLESEQEVLRLHIIPEAERSAALERFNPQRRVYPQVELLHEVFEARVKQWPEAIAVVSEAERGFTYAELNTDQPCGAAVAETWSGARAGSEPCAQRGVEMVVGILGILKAGGAYLPLDPQYPVERLNYLLKDAQVRVVLTRESLREALPAGDTRLELIALESEEIARQARGSCAQRPMRRTAGDLAYVIYTSGSTGDPKGVMVEHQQVLRLFAASGRWFGFDARDVWTLFHSFAFDFSVWELWGALLHGGRLVVVEQAVQRSPEEFYRLLCREGVSVLNQTPSAFRGVMQAQEETRRSCTG